MESREKAQIGLQHLKDAILQVLPVNGPGLGNAEIADLLDLRSDYGGGSKDYLTWSVLGILLNEGKVVRNGRKYLKRRDR